MIRILFTGVGRRIELLQAFKAASVNSDCPVKIYGADMAGTAPALCYCDETRHICAMKDPAYIDELAAICKREKIDLLIPTIDTDLQVLSDNISVFEAAGTRVMISAPDKIRLCRDKNLTSDFFRSCGLEAPHTYNDVEAYDEGYPCFIKPKDGSSSINAFRADNEAQLRVYAGLIEDYVIQPFVDGIEYTVDIMCDFGGNPIFITPRIREAVRAGEVLKTRIVNDPVIVDEMKKLIEAFKPCGPITVQLIKDRSTGIDHYIEINPRYGGGAPLSIKAGADSAEAIIRLLKGETLSFRDNAAAVDAVYSRFDQSVCITPSNQMSIRGVIFDLDDTLYPERQYVQSGYRLIAEYLGDASYAGRLMKYFEDGKQAVDELLAEIGRPEEKEKCIDIYREQIPDISLYPGVLELIASLKDKGIKVGIITDGRVNGQRNKLQALGLDSLIGDENIMITDELGGVQFRKPCDIAFRILQNRWRIPAGQIVYIGDNIAKDMQAPMQLGMQFIYYKNADGIYPRTGSVIDVPVITDISELKL